MRVPKHPTLIRQMIDGRVRQLSAKGPVLSGSLIQVGRRCGRPGCHCASGERHLTHYLSRAVAGKTQMVYVPVDLVEEVHRWVEEHKRLKLLVREVTELSMALIRGHAEHKKLRRGRS